MTTLAKVLEPKRAQDATEQWPGQTAAATACAVWNWGGSSAPDTSTVR